MLIYGKMEHNVYVLIVLFYFKTRVQCGLQRRTNVDILANDDEFLQTIILWLRTTMMTKQKTVIITIVCAAMAIKERSQGENKI